MPPRFHVSNSDLIAFLLSCLLRVCLELNSLLLLFRSLFLLLFRSLFLFLRLFGATHLFHVIAGGGSRKCLVAVEAGLAVTLGFAGNPFEHTVWQHLRPARLAAARERMLHVLDRVLCVREQFLHLGCDPLQVTITQMPHGFGESGLFWHYLRPTKAAGGRQHAQKQFRTVLIFGVDHNFLCSEHSFIAHAAGATSFGAFTVRRRTTTHTQKEAFVILLVVRILH
jgi:hypothetical protein